MVGSLDAHILQPALLVDIVLYHSQFISVPVHKFVFDKLDVRTGQRSISLSIFFMHRLKGSNVNA